MKLFKKISTCLLLFFVSNAAVAQPLSSVLPKDDASLHDLTPAFSWNTLPAALSYHVSLSQDITFATGLVQSPALTAPNWSPASNLTYGTWYWKVTATTASANQSSAVMKFTLFDPSQLSSLALWLKADSGLVLDGSGRVQTWTDLSTNAYQFTQATSTKRPAVIATSFNNLPSLAFSGGQVLNGGDVLDIGLNSRSIFAFCRMGPSNQTIFSKSKATGVPDRYSLLKDGTQTALLYNEASGNHIYSAVNNSNFAYYSAQINRTTGRNRLYCNNVLLGQSNNTPSYNFNSPFRFLIGGYNDAADVNEVLYLNGNISELVFTNSSDSVEIKKVAAYYRYKYSPPPNLGRDTMLAQFCPFTLSLPTIFSSYLWSNGATTNAITVITSGTYWVRTTDIFGVTAYDTVQLTFPSIDTPSSTAICLGQTGTWNTNLGSGYTYLWSTGATSPSISVSNAGNYSVKVTDGLGCFKFSDTLLFTVDNYAQTASLGADTNLCSGNLLSLQSGAASTVSYTWSGGSTGTTLQVNATGTYSLESINLNGCILHDTIHVTVTGQAPTVDFLKQNQCLGLVNNFTDQSFTGSADPIVGWSWSFGDGGTSTAQHPSYIYASSGIYSVKLIATTAGNCSAYLNQDVTVYTLPTAAYTKTGQCSGQSIQFTDQSTLGSAVINSWLWNFGQPSSGISNVSTLTNPSRSYAAAGSYSVVLEVTDMNGCKGSTTQTVTVNQTPIAAFTFNEACVAAPINFVNTSTMASNATYLWTFSDNTSSILTSPTKSFANYGTQTATLKVSVPNGCINAVQQQIPVHPNPTANFTLGAACKGAYLSLEDLSTIPTGSIASSRWVINTTDTLYGLNSAYLIKSFGQQEIKLSTTSQKGCKAEKSTFIEVNNALTANFSVGTGIIAAAEQYTFENLSIGTANYVWNFGDGEQSNLTSPSHIYAPTLVDSSLTVTLFASTPSGCKDTVQKTITIATATLDLLLDKLFIQKQDQQLIVGVQLANTGTIAIDSVELKLRSAKGDLFTETWTGSLSPSETKIYILNAKPSAFVSDEDDINSYLCVTGLGFGTNQKAETNLSNNEVCANYENTQVVLLPVYPNPVSNTLNLQLLVSSSSSVSLTLTDEQGRLIMPILNKEALSSALYTYSIDLKSVRAGVYLLHLTSEGVDKVHRLVVIN